MDAYLKSKLIQFGIALILITLPIGFFQTELANNNISLERNDGIIKGLTGLAIVLIFAGWYQLRKKDSFKK